MPSLDQILARTATTLPALRERRAELERAAADLPLAPGLAEALSGLPTVALIAEVKRRSPSVGAINEQLDPVRLATAYADGGAAAISVLTDGPFFGGSLEDLRAVASALARPVLRKDFILDEVQLLEAKAAGASAALLIVRALKQARLVTLADFAVDIGLDVLVEAHDASELDRALDSGARVIGVNARNLDDFTIDRDAAWGLLSRIPSDRIAVAESGMATPADVERAAMAGADAVLIGSALAASGDPRESAARLSGVVRHAR